jgi:kinesin family member 2/24
LLDLLNARQQISVLEDSFGDTRLLGAKEIRVCKVEELTTLIETANSFRRVAKTHKNDQSSRSHAICRITLANSRAPAVPDGVLYLIDLAGSEIGADTVRHTPELMKEAKDINKSLSVLKECVRGRAVYVTEAEQKPYVPFRHSALTKVLKHVFDPAADRECKTAVIACLNPSFLDVEGTKNTLRYAEMLRIAVPTRKPLEFDAKNPRTWNNAQTKAWIIENASLSRLVAQMLTLLSVR